MPNRETYRSSDDRMNAIRERRYRERGYAELPAYLKRDISNQRSVDELASSGDLAEFQEEQKKRSLWSAVKTTGAGALDVLSRPMYSTTAALSAAAEGNPILPAVGKELFSGIGGLKGEKQSAGEYLGKAIPEYGAFQREHPWQSLATDFAANLALDWSNLIPAKGAATIGGAILKGAGKVVPGGVKNMVGKTFDTAYNWKKANAPEGAVIKWEEQQFADMLRSRYGKQIEPVTKFLYNKKVDPALKNEFALVAMGDKSIDTATPIIKSLVEKADDVFVKQFMFEKRVKSGATPVVRLSDNSRVGLRDYVRMSRSSNPATAARLEGAILPEGWIAAYLPHRPKAYTELMTEAGELATTGLARGNKIQKSPFEHQKELKTGESLLNFMREKGVAEGNIGTALGRSIESRGYESAAKIQTIRTHERWKTELPDTFRKLENGTKVPWDKQVRPGEALWMPAGNLRFFGSEIVKLNKTVRDAIEHGGIVTGDELADLVKSIPSISRQVEVYAVPLPVAQDINRMSRVMAEPDDLMGFWDKLMYAFKGTAVLSPGFHIRNFVSSGAQNYVAGMNPVDVVQRYNDAVRIFASGKADKVAGKAAGAWRGDFEKFGINKGGIITQETGGKQRPLGETIGKIFELNRDIGRTQENLHRAALYIDGIKKGMKPTEAALRVKKFHFDYGDLTDIEKNFLKRAMPFYAWSRNNVPLQIEMLMKAPGKYRNIAKLKEAFAGGETSEYQPDWWKNQDVWETKFKDKGGNRMAVGVNLPYSDLNMMGKGSVIGSFGPLSALINIAGNYDPFYGKQITEFPGQKASIVTIGDKQVQLPARVVYAINNLIPFTKRYGTDLSEEIANFVSKDKNPEANWKLLSKAMIRIIPLTKEREEKNRVYRMMKDLHDFKLKKQAEEAKPPVFSAPGMSINRRTP